MDRLQYSAGGNGGAAAAATSAGNGNAGGDGAGRVVHPRRDPERLVNRYQPGHKFLEQLPNKSPMSLVNEVARYHNFKAEYILQDCIGPNHSKVYRVELHFGNFEKFLGDGSSMRAAQRNAAVSALQNTQFGFPRVHFGGHAQQTAGSGPWNGGGCSPITQTPASELNTLMMKKGIQPKYELTEEKPPIFNEAEHCSQYLPEFDETLHFDSQAHQHYCPTVMTKPPLLPSPDHHHHHHKGPHLLNGKMYPNVEAVKFGWPTPIAQQMAAAYGHPNGYFVPPPPPPYMYHQPAAYIRPNHYHSSSSYASIFPYRAPISSHYSPCNNSNSDYSSAHHSYHPHVRHSTADKWNLYPVSPYLSGTPAQTNKINSANTNFEAKLEIEGQQFTGQGCTPQAARHSAANEALKVLKTQKSLQKSPSVQVGQKSASSANSVADEPSPVSLVYEYANRKRFEVLFETVRESGQVHLRSFLMRCSLFSDASKQPFLTADGEDFSKKAAKRVAAQAMLNALKEKDTDSPKKDAPSSVNKVLSPPKAKQLSVTSSEQQQQHKKQQQEKPNAEQKSAEECAADSTISCRFVTQLYNLTRNMSITHPIYLLSTVPETDKQLIESFKAALGDSKGDGQKQQQQSSDGKSVLHKVECSVTFEQRLPEQTTCQVVATGYGASARIAKSIATYICLQKLGVALPPIDTADSSSNSSSSTLLKLLNFSLTYNQNVPEAVRPIGEEDTDLSSELLIKSATACIEQNLQFIIHILGKLYLFTLKNSTKSLECIFAKLESSLMTFYATKYPTVAASEVAMKCALLEQCVDSLPDRRLYWTHLELISALVLLGVNTAELQKNAGEKRPLLHFESHFFSAPDKRVSSSSSSSPPYVSLITGHCDGALASTFNFSLIKKNFINFGLGSSEEAAREMASYWILKNLAYQARKQIIDNEYVETTDDVQTQLPTGSTVNQHRSPPSGAASKSMARSPRQTVPAMNNNNGDKSGISSPGVAKSRSKSSNASYGQLISKECIGLLFRAANELNIRKPEFKSKTLTLAAGDTIANPEKVSLARDLIHTSCSLTFIQEVPDQLTTRVSTFAIAPSQRIGRTICAYLALCKLGVAKSLQAIIPQLSTADDFATYLRLTQCNGALFPTQHCTSHSSPLSSTLQQQPLEQKVLQVLPANVVEEVGRNLDFVTHILQEVYRPFLKNHRMSCPGLLLGRIERELFEYHNRQQQIMDESGAFDRCSAHIEKCIGELVRQYDGTQFWDHLQLLSAIAALLTANLAQPLVPSPLHFNCSLSKCAEFSLNKLQQTPTTNGQQQQQTLSSSTASISVAIITVSSALPDCSQTHDLARKSCLSFSLGETEPLARERAAYKALRQLAINLWK